MIPFARKLHDYRWELWLFAGTFYAYLISDFAIEWAGFLDDISHTQRSNLLWAISLEFLVVPYWWVRKLNRPFLVALWQYMLLKAALWFLHDLLYQSLLYQDNPNPPSEPWHIPVRWLLVASLHSYQIILLLAFSRRLSRVDMNKVVAFVLIISFMHLDVVVRLWYIIHHHSSPEVYLILWVKPLLLGLVFAYITCKADGDRPLPTPFLLTVMSLVYGGYLWFVVREELPYLTTHNWHWVALQNLLFAWNELSPTHVVVWVGTLVAVFVCTKRKPPPPITLLPPDESDTLITGPQHPVPVKQ